MGRQQKRNREHADLEKKRNLAHQRLPSTRESLAFSRLQVFKLKVCNSGYGPRGINLQRRLPVLHLFTILFFEDRSYNSPLLALLLPPRSEAGARKYSCALNHARTSGSRAALTCQIALSPSSFPSTTPSSERRPSSVSLLTASGPVCHSETNNTVMGGGGGGGSIFARFHAIFICGLMDFQRAAACPILGERWDRQCCMLFDIRKIFFAGMGCAPAYTTSRIH